MKSWLGALMAGAFLLLAPQAHAYIITHNGIDLGGTTGSGEVDVSIGLLPLGDCNDGTGQVCIFKDWGAGSERQTVTLTVTPEGDDPVDIVFLEFVLNGTGIAWSDYHVSFAGAEAGGIAAAAVLFASDLTFSRSPDVTGLGTSSASFFFDPALQPTAAGGEILAIVALIDGAEGGVTITQRPSIPEPATLSLLGLGLLGLGLVRRRAA